MQFLQCNWNCSRPVRLHNFLNFDISKTIWGGKLLFACNKISIGSYSLIMKFFWEGSGMPIVLWNNKSPVSMERVVGFSLVKWVVLWNISAIWVLKEKGLSRCTFLGVKWYIIVAFVLLPKALFMQNLVFKFLVKILLANQFSINFWFVENYLKTNLLHY